MKQKICTVVCTVFLLVISVATFLAAIEIESILWTGIVCSIAGTVASIVSVISKRYRLAIAGIVIPIFALVLFLLEAAVLNLGPARAALPFCIAFLVIQALETMVILGDFRRYLPGQMAKPMQISIRSLLVITTLLAVTVAAINTLNSWSNPFNPTFIDTPWIGAASMALILSTVYGLISLFISHQRIGAEMADRVEEKAESW